MQVQNDDQTQINDLTAAFFNLFTRDQGRSVSLEAIHDLFIPEGLIVKACDDAKEAYNLVEFIEPRKKLLNGEALTSFREEELSGRTEIVGNIAQRICSYRKWGVLSGEPFEGRGSKIFQFVRLASGWRISAVAWYDDVTPGHS